MVRAAVRDPLKRFVEDLARTLDVQKTIRNLGITKEDAEALLSELCELLNTGKISSKAFYYLYVDGASRGNPGKAGAGAVIKDSKGRILKKLRRALGVTTNNMAEYRAMIMALEQAKDLGLKRIKVFADSELLVKQINGLYRVRSEDLRPLYERALGLIEDFEEFSLEHIPRTKNSEADRLANEAIDGGHRD